MSITTCTTALDSQLARLGDLQTLLNATASSSGMDKALDDATAWAERYITGRSGARIRRQVYEETLAGAGTARLMVGRVPLWGVQRFFNDTDTGSATEFCSTDFRIEDEEAGFITRVSDAGFQWTPMTQFNLSQYPLPASVTRPFLLTYEAGWQLEETSATGEEWATTTTGRTLPADVERAVLMKAVEFHAASGVGTEGNIKSMKVGPLAITYSSESDSAGSGSLDPIERLLTPYQWEV